MRSSKPERNLKDTRVEKLETSRVEMRLRCLRVPRENLECRLNTASWVTVPTWTPIIESLSGTEGKTILGVDQNSLHSIRKARTAIVSR